MTATIQSLVKKLMTVIYSYHDIQNIQDLKIPADKDQFDNKLNALLSQSPKKVYESISPVIESATKTYSDRKFFLYFLLKEAVYLHHISIRNAPLTGEDFTKLLDNLTNFISNLVHLLKTDKGKTIKVNQAILNFDEQGQVDAVSYSQLDLKGLIKVRYIAGSSDCQTGTLSRNHIINPLLEQENSIEKACYSVCMDFKKDLLCKHTDQIYNENIELKAENARLKDALEKEKAKKNAPLTAIKSGAPLTAIKFGAFVTAYPSNWFNKLNSNMNTEAHTAQSSQDCLLVNT